MKRLPRGALSCILVIASAALIHLAATRLLATRDLLAAVLTRFDPLGVLAAFALLSTRLFLFLLAPGWVLYVLAAHLLGKRSAARAGSKRRRTGA